MFKIKPHPFDFLFVGTIIPFIPSFIRPNHITLLRLFLIPFVIWLLLAGSYGWGLLLFLFAALTDAIDGALARSRNQITNTGKLIDPLADKALIGSVIFLIILKYINIWLAMVIIFLELAFLIGALIQIKQGKEPVANRWGKIKMFLQVLGVSLLLLSILFNVDLLVDFSTNIFYLAVIFAVISLLTHGI